MKLTGMRRSLAALAICLLLGACSTYQGPVTNSAPAAGAQGPPLLTGGYAP